MKILDVIHLLVLPSRYRQVKTGELVVIVKRLAVSSATIMHSQRHIFFDYFLLLRMLRPCLRKMNVIGRWRWTLRGGTDGVGADADIDQ